MSKPTDRYIGCRIQVADPDGALLDAKLVRYDVNSHQYIADLNGFEVAVPGHEVRRQMRWINRLGRFVRRIVS